MQNLKFHFLTFSIVFIWSLTFVATKILLIDFSAFEIMFYRFIIGFICLLLVKPSLFFNFYYREEIFFFLAAFTGCVCYFLFENIALSYTNSANVAIIVSIAPLASALLSFAFFKTKLSKNLLIGAFIAFVGVCFIAINSLQLELNLTGDLLSLLAALSWAFYSNIIKKLSSSQLTSLAITQKVFFYAILIMFCLIPIFKINTDNLFNISNENLFLLLSLGIIASALCFLLWNLSVSILGVITTSLYLYLMPAIATLSGIFLLNEQLSFLIFIGLMFILCGLLISDDNCCQKLTSLIDLNQLNLK